MNIEQKSVELVKQNYPLGEKFYKEEGMKAFFMEKRKKYKYMCIFGAGVLGTTLCRWLESNNIKTDYFCDNNKNEKSQRIMDVPYISFEELKKIKDDTYVMVSVTNKGEGKKYNDQIRTQLKDFPHVMENILKFIGFYTNDYNLDFDTCVKYTEKIVKTLEDQRSKEIFHENLKYKFISDGTPVSSEAMEKFYNPLQYFSKEYYKNRKDDVIVDCGAYKGDTLKEFTELFKDSFSEYHCFEMDKAALVQLRKNIGELPEELGKKIYVHPYGVYKNSGTAFYDMSTDTLASSIKDTGKNQVKLVSLDEELKDRRITMINMDIEGSELAALQGADRIIEKNRPMLAISIYHSTEQFLSVPYYLMEKYPFYKFYLGMHTAVTDDCVLYAVLQ